MTNLSYRLAFLLFFGSFALTGQTDFRQEYDSRNPAPSSSGLPLEERFKVHRQFVEEAKQQGDSLHWLLGELYLFYDNLYRSDYAAASEQLLLAETIAQASGNAGWQGWVSYRRGTLHLRLRQTGEAIAAYKQAVEKCSVAGDSLCVAENLEQISAVYALQDSFLLAEAYFKLALPMLRRFGDKKQLATAFANFGSFLNQQDRHAEAIVPLQEAMDLQDELGNLIGFGKAKNNLALSYLRTGKVPEALKLFGECLRFNQEHGFRENVLRNYAGIRESYLALEDYRSAYDYQTRYIELKDSLLGGETRREIAELEAKYNNAQQTLALRDSELQLEVAQRKSQQWGGMALIIFIAALASTWYWRRKNKVKDRRIAENRKNLDTVTRLLARKNEALLKLEEAMAEMGEVLADDAAKEDADPKQITNLFDQSILTNTDWADFKVYFENSFPGFVQRLRKRFPGITEAEERLFLLIKLNLTSREISNILGISASGVKKTRNRLRKKLALSPEVDLEGFVRDF